MVAKGGTEDSTDRWWTVAFRITAEKLCDCFRLVLAKRASRAGGAVFLRLVGGGDLMVDSTCWTYYYYVMMPSTSYYIIFRLKTYIYMYPGVKTDMGA